MHWIIVCVSLSQMISSYDSVCIRLRSLTTMTMKYQMIIAFLKMIWLRDFQCNSLSALQTNKRNNKFYCIQPKRIYFIMRIFYYLNRVNNIDNVFFYSAVSPESMYIAFYEITFRNPEYDWKFISGANVSSNKNVNYRTVKLQKRYYCRKRMRCISASTNGDYHL